MKKTKIRFHQAFTLVENIVVFVILGIIIFLVVPKLLQNNTERKNKVILRKAVMSYEAILNKAITSNSGIRDKADLNYIIHSNSCQYARNILTVELVDADNCIFKTSDGIWWNMSNPSKVYMSIDGKEALSSTSEALENAANDNDKKTFFIPYLINNNSVSILTGASTDTESNALSKTTSFLISR